METLNRAILNSKEKEDKTKTKKEGEKNESRRTKSA